MAYMASDACLHGAAAALGGPGWGGDAGRGCAGPACLGAGKKFPGQEPYLAEPWGRLGAGPCTPCTYHSLPGVLRIP